MDQLGTFNPIWDFVSRDVSLWGGMQSPMLSWLGSCGIVLFFLWQVGMLLRAASSARQPFDRLRCTLTALAKDRRTLDRERATTRAMIKDQRRSILPSDSHSDCDDLEKLDTVMEKEHVFRHPWDQFRKTLLIEHAPWFVDPRIYSTRRAEEFFTHEALLSSRINLVFYSQLPSLITGVGLLLTFLALFVGLSKLHADGQTIDGIQGLINGLAGKFLTSIIGLVCANAFVLIEKPVVFRLMNVHQEFLDLMDELFPRKTIEQMLDDFLPVQKEWGTTRPHLNPDATDRFRVTVAESLVPPVTALTAAVHSLARWKQEDETSSQQRLVADVCRAIQGNLHIPFTELREAIHDLTSLLSGIQAMQQHSQANLDQVLARLTEALDNRPAGLPPPSSRELVCSQIGLSTGKGKLERNPLDARLAHTSGQPGTAPQPIRNPKLFAASTEA